MATTTTEPNLLIVDDDENIQRLLATAAKDLGWRPAVAGTGTECLNLLSPSICAVILDHVMPGMNGYETLCKIRQISPTLPVIMLTGLHDVETAVRAMRAGATDYLTKPFELKPLFSILSQCRIAHKDAPQPVISVKEKPANHSKLSTKNPKVRELLSQLAKAAKLDSTILLTGESGTGKTRFAREIHKLSHRASENFITVSCPALPRELLESELFGHERGAFTGATTSRVGRFEQATNGTLFLDEIGDLPMELQPKLLTVLQDREFFRVGGTKQLETRARVIAATNINLRERVEQGLFREDLYYRLNIIELYIPALRERKEDIPSLSAEILSDISKRRGVENWQIAKQAMEALCHYPWPGNVRQLQNVLERATAFSEQPELQAQDITPLLETRDAKPVNPSGNGLQGATLHELERNAFTQAYLGTGKNKAKTARELGISERSVYNLVERYGLKLAAAENI